MSRIEILSISTDEMDRAQLFKARLTRPAAREKADAYAFPLAGWVLGREKPVESLVVTCLGQQLKTVPVSRPHLEASLRFPAHPGSPRAGFSTEIGVIGLPNPCTLKISARLQDGPLVPFATVLVRHAPLESAYVPQLQPLMITSLGRSGSTWSMRLFGEHPEIVYHRAHPYETMPGSYWMHMVKVLSDPANHTQSTAALGFADRLWLIGQNPFYTRNRIPQRAVQQWFGSDLVLRTAGFCQQNIDEFYLALAKAQGDPQPRFFAEKNRANHLPRMFFDLYPGAREIFVVRDFRDMACSMFSFNQKRGYVGVGPQGAGDEVEFLRQLRPSIQRLLDAARERADRSLLLKYEDLILNPGETIPRVLAYLGVRSDPQTIAGMLRRANRTPAKNLLKSALVRVVPRKFQAGNREFFARIKPHRTTGGDAGRSVGRWKSDLTPELQSVAHEAFGDLLEQAGYPVP